MSNLPENMHILRESYYALKIGREPDEHREPIWVKKLRHILNADIHHKPLGCRIENTHIIVGAGDVHMGSFFEAQILFSHAKWVANFTEWLGKQIEDKLKGPCLVVGYETYVEPVLANLRSRNGKIRYCIYEEPKYTQRNQVSKERLRYIEDALPDSRLKNIVYLCGISATLGTFKKMRQALERHIENDSRGTGLLMAGKKESFFSIIQVLSKDGSSFALDDDITLNWDKKEKIMSYISTNSQDSFQVNYLVDVEADWEAARTCKWCFPESFMDERPLITTGPSSVIPVQRIGASRTDGVQREFKGFSAASSILFRLRDRKSGEFVCERYLYYSHIERGGHHFRYYIRTSAFLNHALKQKAFDDYCQAISETLPKNFEDHVHVLISPHHFSNDRFPHEINRRVFKNMAHEIAFDPRREFRSNFETKYSNFAYVLEQISRINDEDPQSEGKQPHRVYFYYVDDEIITGSTFYRAKSFVTSLMRNFLQEKSSNLDSFKIFSAVITLVDRTSASSKYNYVDDLKNFHHFVHFSIPSLRSYGDACPLCKQIQDAQNVSKNCCLNSTALYWKEKEAHLRLRSLEEMRMEIPELSEKLRQRQFNRLYCENTLWEKTKSLWTESEIGAAYLTTIYQEIKNLGIERQYEYLISFLKALSRPFLFYKENGKKSALRLLLCVLDEYLEMGSSSGQLIPSELIWRCANREKDRFPTTFRRYDGNAPAEMSSDDYLRVRYALLCVLISCLSEVGSNYLIKVEHIDKLCDYVAGLHEDYCCFSADIETRGDNTVLGFYTILVNNFKRLICGVSGEEKSASADNTLWNLLSRENDTERSVLYQVLYLENIQRSAGDASLTGNLQTEIHKDNQNTIEKYMNLSGILSNTASAECTFFADYNKRIIELTKSVNLLNRNQVFEHDAESALQQRGYYIQKMPNDEGECFWIVFKINRPHGTGADDISEVYLRLRFDNSSNENFKTVRKILIQRATILQVIQADIETGALKTAIQARAAEAILLTDKTQSHGQSSDINRLFGIVRKQFAEAREEHKKEELLYAYDAINLFMNRCIALGATKTVMGQYFSPPSAIQPFSTIMQFVSENRDIVRCDLKTYLETLKDNKHEYIALIQRNLLKKHGGLNGSSMGQVNVNITVNNLENFNRIVFVPSIIDVSSSEGRCDAIQLIGLIDLFVRNAIEHGGKTCDICISCEIGETVVADKAIDGASYNRSYAVTVRNEISNDAKAQAPSSIGFTKMFLTKYLRELPKNEPQHFVVTMEELEQNIFQSQLVCVVPEYGGQL